MINEEKVTIKEMQAQPWQQTPGTVVPTKGWKRPKEEEDLYHNAIVASTDRVKARREFISPKLSFYTGVN